MKSKKVLSVIISFLLIFSFTLNLCNAESVTKPTSSVKYGDYIYYSLSCAIYKMNVNTKKVTTIKIGNVSSYYDLVVKDGWIYCVYNDDPVGVWNQYVYRIRTNGKDGKTLDSGCNPIIYNNKIYYTKLNNIGDSDSDNHIKGIYSMSLSGKNKTAIKKSDSINQFTVYKSKIYYVDQGRKKYYLKKIGLSGTSVKTMTTSTEQISDLCAYSDNIYFRLGEYQSNVYKINVNSTSKSKILSNCNIKTISNGYLYYTVFHEDNYKTYLYKMNLKTKSKTLIMKKYGLKDIQVSNNYIICTYFINGDNFNSAKVNTCRYICNTNGKNGKKVAYDYTQEGYRFWCMKDMEF